MKSRRLSPATLYLFRERIMVNVFQSFAHCWRYARRRAIADGDTFHIVRTSIAGAPRLVLSDRQLFGRDEIEPDDIEASADRKSTPSELQSLMRISYAVFCLKKKQHIIHDRSHVAFST